jgi:hypothetical protein
MNGDAGVKERALAVFTAKMGSVVDIASRHANMVTWEDVDQLQTAAMTGDAGVKERALVVFTAKMGSVVDIASRNPTMVTREDVEHLREAAMRDVPGAQDLLNKLASSPAK